MNINRDYLIINDVKKSNITLDNGSMFFYITDKNTQNIFVNLVINVSNNELIQKFANIENAEDYTLTMNIVKPDNTYKVVEGKLHDKEKAIFEFNLNEDCCDEIGTYRCELLTKCTINDHEEITTSNKLTYKVKSSVLNDLDDIVEAPEYPLVIQLFDKLSDIEQYEEDRRANELARQLAEEQRQARFNTLDADMTNSIQAIDDKVVDVEDRISSKEQAVDKLIVDTKADIDGYKEAKDQEIDEYKALKDTEINNAITAQDNKIDEAISNQNDRIALVENNDTTQNNRLDTLENRATQHESRLDAIEVKNQQQDDRLDIVENKNTQQDNRLTTAEAKNVEQDNRLDEIEAIDVAQNNRLDAIEVKNQEQDDRLLDIEKVNKRQDMNLKCLFAESKNNMIDITEEGNSIYLQNSTTGYTLIDEIKGNTLVNCNKEPDKELILNGNINTQGDNNITITEGVDGGLVDVSLEGNTLVNVSKTKDSTAISKAYTVENSGNHIALQGDIDGSCRPVITGKTLVNLKLNTKDNCNVRCGGGDKSTYVRIDESSPISLKGEILQSGQANNNIWQYYNLGKINTNLLKTDTTYTLIIRDEYKSTKGVYIQSGDALHCFTVNNSVISTYVNNYNYVVFKTKDDFTGLNPDFLILYGFLPPDYAGKLDISIIGLFEGDWTDKAIPTEYFKGLQSSFEDNLVTQEMVDSGEEVADNLGKYKVEYKSTQADGTVGNTKTLYLNSPLLEGDTIEEKDNGIYHVHRSELVAYTEGDETSLITDKVKTLHGLEIPTYELIEQSNLTIDSYANGHLDFNTAVPVEKVEFKSFSEELTYLYANTQYTVQFVSDKATTADITLGGTQLLAQNIVAGLNRISITTPVTLTNNKLIINGVGANISEVVVTDTDREFGYFEGMKSVGEGGNLEITSSNSDNTLSNTQQLTHEPLRAVGHVKDRYVLIDGKWYIERNTKTINASDLKWTDTGTGSSFAHGKRYIWADITTGARNNSIPNVICKDYLPIAYNNYNHDGECIYVNEVRIYSYINDTLEQFLIKSPEFVIMRKTPIYEPIDYNPLEVYADVTHISANSLIPTNITVKNHGFNCLLKPSTTYTISSNLGLNTVTTPSVLTEDCLRFMDTDTSDVTTMRDVLVLEGDWTTKADLIPSNFSGIESAFEQEYDAEKGKYKVNVKVANEDKTKENNITFYINEPLRGVGEVKDRVYVKDDKVVVERNCGIRAYEDGDFGTYPTDKVNTVYQLAEPTYEKVEYNDTKLFIESFKNSTLFYNSNVPVTSKLYYSYSVPIVDTVAQTANVTDQQDSMIIDLATQVAVMEMMLM